MSKKRSKKNKNSNGKQPAPEKKNKPEPGLSAKAVHTADDSPPKISPTVRRPFHAGHRAPLYFLLLSAVCQASGIVVLSLIKGATFHPMVLLALHSVVAFIAARMLYLTVPWQLFNLLLAPAVIAYTYFNLPSGLALAALIFTALLYAPTFWTRVPYYPTTPRMYDAILEQLPAEGSFRFLDLGCGLGRLLAYLTKHRPNGRFEGVEISPLAFLAAWSWMKLLGRKNVQIFCRNFWNISLEDYDIVYAFLAPGPMPALWDKVKQEMRHGTLFITNTFAVEASKDDQKRLKTITIDGPEHQNTLYLHRIESA